MPALSSSFSASVTLLLLNLLSSHCHSLRTPLPGHQPSGAPPLRKSWQEMCTANFLEEAICALGIASDLGGNVW